MRVSQNMFANLKGAILHIIRNNVTLSISDSRLISQNVRFRE